MVVGTVTHLVSVLGHASPQAVLRCYVGLTRSRAPLAAVLEVETEIRTLVSNNQRDVNVLITGSDSFMCETRIDASLLLIKIRPQLRLTSSSAVTDIGFPCTNSSYFPF